MSTKHGLRTTYECARLWTCALSAALLLQGCGGGGGGGGSNASAPTFSAALTSPASGTAIAGYAQDVAYAATLTYNASANLYIVVEYDSSLVSTATGNVSGDTLIGTLSFLSNLAPGNYSTSLRVHACLDSGCAQEVSGSPVNLPVSLSVLPNISVQTAQVNLQRTGADPAPTASVLVTVPAAAGTVTATPSSTSFAAISSTFDGTTIQISTTQVPSGVYTQQIVLQGSADSRYVQTVNVTYTVNPPAGGEVPLTVTPNSLYLTVPQGTVVHQQFTVTRPTWTSAWDPPNTNDTTGQLTLTDLGNGAYDLAINAAGAPSGNYDTYISFSAGPTGGTASLYLTWAVATVFYPSGTFSAQLDATSTPATLQLGGPIQTFDGIPATWSASTTASWLSLSPATGTTGVDNLTISVDPALGGGDTWQISAPVTLAVNRPGTLPETQPITVTNYIPELQRSVAVLSGTGGRIYVDGAIPDFYSALLSSGTLNVSGATLVAASYRTDTRFIGTVSLLALDVTGAQAGIPIVVSANTPLLSSQVSIVVKDPVIVAPAYAALPFGAYRPGAYAPGLDAFYFSAPDTVYRWAQAGGSWPLSQATVTGTSGVAVRQDEQALEVPTGANVVRLDPVTLAQIASGGPLLDNTQNATQVFDATGPATESSLAFAADGRALAATASLFAGQVSGRTANWIAATQATRKLTDLTSGPVEADPGQNYVGASGTQSGIGLVASPSRLVVLASDGNGRTSVYNTRTAAWSPGPALATGVTAAGVTDSGTRVVGSDGLVLDGTTIVGNLNSVLPVTHLSGGFGLTQDGHYGLVYGYQTDPGTGAQPATGGTVWVVDLSQAPAQALSPVAIVATIPLASPVGCTSVTLASGETCQHSASITVAPGSASAFVLGPRGVASIALPALTKVPLAAAMKRAVAIRPSRTLRAVWVGRPAGMLRSAGSPPASVSHP